MAHKKASSSAVTKDLINSLPLLLRISTARERLNLLRPLGFDARACIVHPGQVALLHQKLATNSEEVCEVTLIVDAFESADGGRLTMNGRLVEKPVVGNAQKVLTCSLLAEKGTR
jgi:citrate lyase beta subunit